MTRDDHKSGPLKCPRCPRRYSDRTHYDRHVATHAGAPKTAANPPAGETSSTPGAGVGGANPPSGSPSVFAYPSLEDWEKAKSSAQAPGATAPLTTAPPAPGVPPQQVVHFHLGPAWKIAGNFIDTTILKDKSIKVNMDDRKAKDLDESLSQIGFVTNAVNQVVVPWWIPLVVSIFAAFVLPILASLLMDRMTKKKEDDEGKKTEGKGDEA